MVLFMHIDYNNGCTGVFRMCLMVIDICIDETLGFLAGFFQIIGSGGSYGISNAGIIDTGSGHDTITGSNSIANNGIINTGEGNDRINGIGHGIFNHGLDGYGIINLISPAVYLVKR